MAAAGTSTKKPKRMYLRSSDLVCYEVEEDVASMSDFLKKSMEDSRTDLPIRDVEVNSKILDMVFKFCKYHLRHDKPDFAGMPARPSDKTAAWDAQFVDLELQTLFDLFRAADCMKILKLRNLTTQQISHVIKNMPAEEIKRNFNAPDFNTPEEEAKVRERLIWLYAM